MADGQVVYEIRGDDANLDSDLSSAEKKISKSADVFKAIGLAAAATFTAAVSAGKELWNLANDVALAGDNIDKMSQKIGISTDAYQEWDYVFKRCGTDVNNLQTGMKTLSDVITDAGNGSESAQKKLGTLGLTFNDLADKSLEDQFEIVLTHLQGMESGAARTAAATDLLGRSATDLGAVLNMTAEETQLLRYEFGDYGMNMTKEAVAASAAFEDSLTKLQGVMAGTKTRIAQDFLPGITLIFDAFSDILNGFDRNGREKLTQGINIIAESLEKSFSYTMHMISSVVDNIIGAAPKILGALAKGIIDNLPMIIETALDIILTLAKGLVSALPKMIPAVVDIILKIIDVLIDNIDMLIDVSVDLILAIAEGLIRALPLLMERAPEIIYKLTMALIRAVPTLLQAAWEIIKTLVSGIAQRAPDVLNAGGSLIANLLAMLLGKGGAFSQVGSGIISGIGSGITSGWNWLTSKVSSLASSLLSSAKKALHINSPSTDFKEQVSGNIVRGLVTGLDDYGDDAIEATEQVTREMLAAANVSVRAGVDTSGLYSALDSVTGINASVTATHAPIVIHNELSGSVDVDGFRLGKIVLQNLDDAAAYALPD